MMCEIFLIKHRLPGILPGVLLLCACLRAQKHVGSAQVDLVLMASTWRISVLLLK